MTSILGMISDNYYGMRRMRAAIYQGRSHKIVLIYQRIILSILLVELNHPMWLGCL